MGVCECLLLEASVNPRTYKGATHPYEVFLIFFLDDKTSATDAFSSCSFIPGAHFETSSVMVNFYGCEIITHMTSSVASGQANFE